ncbi:hypothetical protein [Streptomyces sp. NBC_01803]|uniref:hypothetical protein n=1 Tax=Streptomyces sp. NBC_01803 TaxID=2975946 RepID=UPI002DD968A5|nr:hypothetical protein [Streptomyces sp. NBC_01803]WSA45104.1 hypothetical protein OIE51_13345 [Streptomyces sp. NBC_01803]
MTGSQTERAYPVRPLEGDDDSRFTVGLLFDVCRVIERHGYPSVARGADLVELQLALFRFLYGPSERQTQA